MYVERQPALVVGTDVSDRRALHRPPTTGHPMPGQRNYHPHKMAAGNTEPVRGYGAGSDMQEFRPPPQLYSETASRRSVRTAAAAQGATVADRESTIASAVFIRYSEFSYAPLPHPLIYASWRGSRTLPPGSSPKKWVRQEEAQTAI